MRRRPCYFHTWGMLQGGNTEIFSSTPARSAGLQHILSSCPPTDVEEETCVRCSTTSDQTRLPFHQAFSPSPPSPSLPPSRSAPPPSPALSSLIVPSVPRRHPAFPPSYNTFSVHMYIGKIHLPLSDHGCYTTKRAQTGQRKE